MSKTRWSIVIPSLLNMAMAVWVDNASAESPQPSLLDVVQKYADTMIERGRDTYGPQKSGLLLSAMDRTTLAPLTSRPVAPGGIRREDRPGEPWSALTGANLHLDENLLRILYALSEITGDSKYAQVADEEISWFLKNAMSPTTNLLAWGEHMSWGVMEDRAISGMPDGIHEFARPWVLWERSYALAPEQCEKFALGLWEHQIANHKTGGFDRHALYFKHGPIDGKDFPRHAAFYVLTWGHAYKHTQKPVFLEAIEALLARFERKRVQKDGSMVGTMGPLDCEVTAAMVPEPLAGRLRAFCEKEDELILADMAKQSGAAKPSLVFNAASPAKSAPAGQKPAAGDAAEPAEPPLWRNGYSAGTQASNAMFCLARYEQVHKPAYKDMIVSIADKYANSLPEEDLDAWPLAFAHAISTQVAAYRLTEKPVYKAQAQRLARMAVEFFWQDNPLPRASLKSGHYEAMTGGDSLALSLLEVHALTNKLPIVLPSNTIDR